MLDHPHLGHLTPHEWNVLSEFLSWLREQFGDHIAHVWLFGSKARGDFDEESDVDLLIVTHDGDDALGKAVGEMAYDLSLEHGVLPTDFAERFTGIAGFRNVLTELYVDVDPVKVYEHLQRDPDDIRFFARCIVEYLERKCRLAPR